MKGDQEINWESFYREMMKCGLAEEEIRSMFYILSPKNIIKINILDFFQQYDTDGDMIMSKDELERMRKSLEQLGDFQASSVQLGQKGM